MVVASHPLSLVACSRCIGIRLFDYQIQGGCRCIATLIPRSCRNVNMTGTMTHATLRWQRRWQWRFWKEYCGLMLDKAPLVTIRTALGCWRMDGSDRKGGLLSTVAIFRYRDKNYVGWHPKHLWTCEEPFPNKFGPYSCCFIQAM